MTTYDYSAMAGSGRETIGTDDLGLPMILMANKGSKYADENHPKYEENKIEGAKMGDILFSQDKSILPKPLEIIPIRQLHCYALWTPRNQGGGLTGHAPMSIAVSPQFRQSEDSEGKKRTYYGDLEAIETRYLFVLFKRNDEYELGIISFTSSNHKAARRIIQMINGFDSYEEGSEEAEKIKVPPFFARKFFLDTVRRNDENYVWWEYTVNQEPEVLTIAQDGSVLQQAMEANIDAVKNPVLRLSSSVAEEDSTPKLTENAPF